MPTVPVIPMTFVPQARRQSRASAASATRVSSTNSERAVRPTLGRFALADGGGGSALQGLVDEVVPVLVLAAEGREQISGLHKPGVGRPAQDRRFRAPNYAIAVGTHALREEGRRHAAHRAAARAASGGTLR